MEQKISEGARIHEKIGLIWLLNFKWMHKHKIGTPVLPGLQTNQVMALLIIWHRSLGYDLQHLTRDA